MAMLVSRLVTATKVKASSPSDLHLSAGTLTSVPATVTWFGGLVFKAYRLLHPSTLGSESNKEEEEVCGLRFRVSDFGVWVSGFGCRVWGVRFRVRGWTLRNLSKPDQNPTGFGLRVWGRTLRNLSEPEASTPPWTLDPEP